MKTGLFAAAAIVAIAAAVPAAANVFAQFTPGGNVSNLAGFTVINAFEVDAGIVGSGYQIKSPPSDGDGAVIPISSPAGTNYLSVLGGGEATIALPNVNAFAFDWGSLDTYNTLQVFGVGGAFGAGGYFLAIPGVLPPNTPGDGNQFLPGTNGLFHVYGNGGETFTSIKLTSSTNSFEIDNLAAPGGVPEPAAWAMMIAGFGLAGAMMRRRRAAALTA